MPKVQPVPGCLTHYFLEIPRLQPLNTFTIRSTDMYPEKSEWAKLASLQYCMLALDNSCFCECPEGGGGAMLSEACLRFRYLFADVMGEASSSCFRHFGLVAMVFRL